LHHKRRSSVNDQQEGLNVLFDFLISLLTWQNSTVWDAANKLFKSFSKNIGKSTLQNMLQIVTTPNADANMMLEGEEEAEEGEGEEDEEEVDSDD